MAATQDRTGQKILTPDQEAKIEALRALRRTPEARAEQAMLRATIEREHTETGEIATTGEKITMADAIAFRRFVMRLRNRREEQGLSLDDVAQRSGMDKGAISRLESGKQANPTMSTLLRYANSINFPIDWERLVDGVIRPQIH